jgi:hypothetical protein
MRDSGGTYLAILDRDGRCPGPCAALDLEPPLVAVLHSRARDGGGDVVTFERAYCGVCGRAIEADPYLLDALLGDRDVESGAWLDATRWIEAREAIPAEAWVALINVGRMPRECDGDDARLAVEAAKAAAWGDADERRTE